MTKAGWMKRIALCLMSMALAVGAGCAVPGSQRNDLASGSVLELHIYTDKDEYTTDEAVSCHATLEYVGDANSVTVYSGDPLLYFTIQGGPFNGDYWVLTILQPTTLKKGDPQRFDFTKSGGYSEGDKDASFWKSWLAEPELKLPAGSFTISATVDCSFDPDDVLASKYKLTASKAITVSP